jgi:enamine deaminase RidA (YjgF/YER057c/UK114 family)
MAHLTFTNPGTLAPPPGFTHVVEIRGPGRLVYVAGQLGLTLDGELAGAPGDFRAQALQAFENVAAALAAVGAGFEHVVKINNYLSDMAHLPILREIRRQYMAGGNPPASTTLAVSGFAREGALFEVEAVAALPE